MSKSTRRNELPGLSRMRSRIEPKMEYLYAAEKKKLTAGVELATHDAEVLLVGGCGHIKQYYGNLVWIYAFLKQSS